MVSKVLYISFVLYIYIYIYIKSNAVNSNMSFKIFNDMAPHAPFFRFVKFDLEHDMDLIILVHILQDQSKPKDFFFFLKKKNPHVLWIFTH